MDNDDKQLGRILSRREILGLFGAGGVTLLAACTTPRAATTTAPTTASTASTASTAASTEAAPVNATVNATAATTPALNAEAQTAEALSGNPTALAETTAEVATVEVANADVTATPACVVRPEVTEGPYYVDEDLVRADIRSDPATGAVKEGIPLVLTFNVSQISNSACAPLQGATVDIWHCDAAGAYSDVSDPGFDTSGQKWLRGSLVTDDKGQATFTTIYPGWYSGRAVHIHFKVHPNETSVFTSQLFFDDALSDQVFTQAPYASKGQRNVLNSNDNIYQDLLLLTTTKTDTGYAAAFSLGIDLSTLGTGESGGQGGPGGGGPGGPPPNGTRPSGGPAPAATATSGG